MLCMSEMSEMRKEHTHILTPLTPSSNIVFDSICIISHTFHTSDIFDMCTIHEGTFVYTYTVASLLSNSN